MSKTATVTKAEYTGKTWTNPDGKTFHFHSIVFDNGDAGEYMSIKSDQTNFKVGEQAEYDLIPKDGYPDKIKPVQSNTGYGGGGGKKYNEKDKYPSFALAYANQLAIANVNSGKVMESKDVMAVADKYLDWLNSK